MLYLVWVALNGTALLYFFASCVTAARAVWVKAGVGPLLTVVVGLVSLNSHSSQSAPRPPHPAARAWAGPVARQYITLEDYYLAAIGLNVTYAAAPDSGQRAQGTTSLTGLKLGVNWLPTATSTTWQHQQLTYSVDGVVEWTLLGTTIYREFKQFNGVVKI